MKIQMHAGQKNQTRSERLQAAPVSQFRSGFPRSPSAITSDSHISDVLRSRGRPLDPLTRDFMESRFDYHFNRLAPSDSSLSQSGDYCEHQAEHMAAKVTQNYPPTLADGMLPEKCFDFTKVRVHANAKAAASARALNALAYTIGNNIVFAAGRYAPEKSEGKTLLAHELTHTVQQNSGIEMPMKRRIQCRATPESRSSPFTGERFAAGELFSGSTLVRPLTDGNFWNIFYDRNKVIVVDFWTSWCRGPCGRIAEHMINLAEHYRSGPLSNRVKFYHVQLDFDSALGRIVNPSLSTRFGFTSVPVVYFYYTATGRVPTLDAPLLEASIQGGVPISEFAWRIQYILRRHGHSSAGSSSSGVHRLSNEQERGAAVSAAQPSLARSTGLLIARPIVRAWMREAYRRSRMGGFIPPQYLSPRVSQELRRRQSDLPTQRECGGKILRAPNGSLHCVFHCTSSARPYSIAVCPSELNIIGNQIGQSTIIGSFHTHPSPRFPERPSSADRTNMIRAQRCHGSESYVIGLDNIYVIYPNGTFRTVGNTGDLLFGGIRRVRPQ